MSNEEIPIVETPSRQSPIISRPPPASIPPPPIPPRSSSSSIPSPMRSQPDPNPFRKRFSLAKWKLDYSGDSCVREFFVCIDERKEADEITDSYLLRRFHEVLSGAALKYFRSIRHEVFSYEDLKLLFFNAFAPSDFEYKTEQEVRGAKQRPDQSVRDFVIQVSYLNDKLTNPIDEIKLIEILTHNMHQKYLPCLSIHRFKDIKDLLDTTSHFESFLPQGSKSVSVITNQAEQCLKCGQTGHSYRLCPKFPGTLCFKCRTPGVITRDCPTCKKN